MGCTSKCLPGHTLTALPVELCSPEHSRARCFCLPAQEAQEMMLCIGRGLSCSMPQTRGGLRLRNEHPAASPPQGIKLGEQARPKHHPPCYHSKYKVRTRCPGCASEESWHPPGAVDLHIVLGAGGHWDARLQHEEHVETHLHVLLGGNLPGQAESVAAGAQRVGLSGVGREESIRR